MIFLSKHLQLVKPIGHSAPFICESLYCLRRIYELIVCAGFILSFPSHTASVDVLLKKAGGMPPCKQIVNSSWQLATPLPPAVLTSAELICHLFLTHTDNCLSPLRVSPLIHASLLLLFSSTPPPPGTWGQDLQWKNILYIFFFPPCWAGVSGMCVRAGFCEECEKTTEL